MGDVFAGKPGKSVNKINDTDAKRNNLSLVADSKSLFSGSIQTEIPKVSRNLSARAEK